MERITVDETNLRGILEQCGGDYCKKIDGDCSRCGFLDMALEKLRDYEKKEQNGMLKHFPCRVGDTVYLIDHNICRNRKTPLECTIDEFTVDHSNECYAVLNGSGKAYYAMRRFRAVNIKDIGKTVFLTREEAEQALKQMGE